MGETIKGAVIGAIITGVIGIIGTVIAADMAKNQGEQETINQLNSQMANISGNNNTVTINSVDDLINEYNALTFENKSLVSQNTKYYDELEEAKSKIEEYENDSNSKVQELEQQLSDKPDIQFKDIGLSIDGNDISMNSKKSSVIIDNRTYYSDEFIKNIIGSNTNMSIQDNIMYIGKIIKEKSALMDQWLTERQSAQFESLVTDGRGVTHTNVIELTNKAYVKYSLNGEYSFFRCHLNIKENEVYDGIGTIIVKADDVEVYKSPDLSKTSDIDTGEISINNCSVLTIEYLVNERIRCIVSDAIVYN